MSGDPSRRPSNERVRVDININATFWIQCETCLGDGWHYPTSGLSGQLDGAPKRFKVECKVCTGLGARQIPSLHFGPGMTRVRPPAGWTADAT